MLYFNPRSPRGERHNDDKQVIKLSIISIHALREESDMVMGKPVGKQRPNFNPRSPRGERPGGNIFDNVEINFNPRSPRGERR